MHSDHYSVVITGLGGQGVLMVSKVIAAAAWRYYDHVCRTESRGLSQRGGSVSTIVRFGKRPATPVLGSKSADALLSLDLLETARSLSCLKSNGVLVSNEQYAMPLSLISKWKDSGDRIGLQDQLSSRLHSICDTFEDTHYVNLSELAESANFAKGLNSVLLGAASVHVPIPYADLREETVLAVKPQFRAANALAFDLGRDAATKQMFDKNSKKNLQLATA